MAWLNVIEDFSRGVQSSGSSVTVARCFAKAQVGVRVSASAPAGTVLTVASLPSKQLVRVRIPLPAPEHIYNAHAEPVCPMVTVTVCQIHSRGVMAASFASNEVVAGSSPAGSASPRRSADRIPGREPGGASSILAEGSSSDCSGPTLSLAGANRG